MGKHRGGNFRETVWRGWMRRQLIRRDGTLCGLCQEPMTAKEMSIDHIMPVSRGGSDKPENLRLAHEKCNQERGAGFFVEREYPKTWDDLIPHKERKT